MKRHQVSIDICDTHPLAWPILGQIYVCTSRSVSFERCYLFSVRTMTNITLIIPFVMKTLTQRMSTRANVAEEKVRMIFVSLSFVTGSRVIRTLRYVSSTKMRMEHRRCEKQQMVKYRDKRPFCSKMRTLPIAAFASGNLLTA